MFLTILDITIAGILMGGIYSLVAAGFNLQYGVARVLNVSHGEFIMLGAVGTYSLYTLFGINPLVSLIICGPIIFLIGLLIHRVVFQRLTRLSGTIEAFEGSSLLACFGLLFIIQNIVSSAWGGSERGYNFLIFPVNLFGNHICCQSAGCPLFRSRLGIGLLSFHSPYPYRKKRFGQ